MIYDVSVPITNTMPVWPGDPPVALQHKSHESGDKSHTVQLTSITMGSHTGTHFDAPYHMIAGGKRLHEFPIETFVGPARVVEIFIQSQHAVYQTLVRYLTWYGWIAVVIEQPRLIPGKEVTLKLRIQLGEPG